MRFYLAIFFFLFFLPALDVTSSNQENMTTTNVASNEMGIYCLFLLYFDSIVIVLVICSIYIYISLLYNSRKYGSENTVKTSKFVSQKQNK